MPATRTHRTPKNARARKDWAPAFLAALERSGMVSEAARAAGVGRRTAYDRRERDEQFAQAWDEALEAATEELEQEAVRRAMDGSDLLLMFLLKARRPRVYVERHQLRHTGSVEFDRPMIEELIDPEVRKHTQAALRAISDARLRRQAQ